MHYLVKGLLYCCDKQVITDYIDRIRIIFKNKNNFISEINDVSRSNINFLS